MRLEYDDNEKKRYVLKDTGKEACESPFSLFEKNEFSSVILRRNFSKHVSTNTWSKSREFINHSVL